MCGEFHRARLSSLRGRPPHEARSVARSLRRFSRRGRVVPEIRDESVRELFVKSYRLIYEIEESRIVILPFLHGSRNFPAALV
jgi:plasmid stabilization system protein ParE